MKDRIFKHEKIYVNLFSAITELPFGYEAEDISQRDKYYHNYLNISNQNYKDKDISRYINKTKKYGFSIIRLEDGINIKEKLIKDATIDTNGIYSTNINDLQFKIKVDAKTKRVDPSKDKAFFDFLFKEDKNFGQDYALGNTKRQKEVLDTAKDVYGYFMIEVENQVIGTLNYCINNDMAKLDDFVVAEDFQKKGYGSKLMHDVIEYLKTLGINEVYLVTNLSDTAKDLYQKVGFKYVSKYQIITIR